MNRDSTLKEIETQKIWDFIIIGGGATGLGAALDACSRGFSTLLLESHDFAKGTSSRSTKLIHGGLRYLKQGHFKLVKEALHEREILSSIASQIVKKRAFIIPCYTTREKIFYGIGLKIYDFLAGRRNLEKSKILGRKKTIECLPNLKKERLKGGVLYFDGQFDDAKLAITLAQTIAEKGGFVLNYFPVIEFLKTDGKISGVVAKDQESGKIYSIKGKAVINATGVFCDHLRKMDDPFAQEIVRPSQGSHIVVDKKFLPTNKAIMIPKTFDQRVVFIIPWLNYILIGTTENEQKTVDIEPKPLNSEIDFLISQANQYLERKISLEDIKSTFAGLRPLINIVNKKSTANIPREYLIQVSASKLITVTGGKWTTYRIMAEKVIDQAIATIDLKHIPSETKKIQLFDKYLSLEKGKLLHPLLPITQEQILFSLRHEMARNLEDILARRTRCLFLNAKATVEIAPQVAKIIADELHYNQEWIDQQLKKIDSLMSQFSK